MGSSEYNDGYIRGWHDGENAGYEQGRDAERDERDELAAGRPVMICDGPTVAITREAWDREMSRLDVTRRLGRVQ